MVDLYDLLLFSHKIVSVYVVRSILLCSSCVNSDVREFIRNNANKQELYCSVPCT
jgi:hypothetical protein